MFLTSGHQSIFYYLSLYQYFWISNIYVLRRVIFLTLLKDVISDFVKNGMLAMTSLYHTLSQMSSIQLCIIIGASVFKCIYYLIKVNFLSCLLVMR